MAVFYGCGMVVFYGHVMVVLWHCKPIFWNDAYRVLEKSSCICAPIGQIPGTTMPYSIAPMAITITNNNTANLYLHNSYGCVMVVLYGCVLWLWNGCVLRSCDGCVLWLCDGCIIRLCSMAVGWLCSTVM